MGPPPLPSFSKFSTARPQLKRPLDPGRNSPDLNKGAGCQQGNSVRWYTCALTELEVTSAVPQGSLLGPLLFLIYVNSQPDAVTACFADGTKIVKRIDSPADCAALQSDLKSLVSWSIFSRLLFNQIKCKNQRITRKIKPVLNMYTTRSY